MKDLIIAIDGYSGCGKSTLAKDLAKILNYTYIDSGAMYRAVTYYCLQEEIIEPTVLKEKINTISISFKKEDNLQNTYLNGKNIEHEIRTLEVANHVSAISKLKFVREKMVAIQRELGKNKKIVMDGRDIGTIVFPQAELKIFMTASIEIRAQRRFEEFKQQNTSVTIDEIIENLAKRDKTDSTRAESPLMKAPDSISLDNSTLSREEQLNFIIDLINKKFR